MFLRKFLDLVQIFNENQANELKRKRGSNRDKIEHTELLIYTLEIPITTKLGSIN